MRTVWCPTCKSLDARWLLRGHSIKEIVCAECGDALLSTSHAMARLHFFDYLGLRARNAVLLAVNGQLNDDDMVETVRMVVHEAFKRRLVPRWKAEA